MLELTITSASAVKPRYCCNGRSDGYHHDQSQVKRHAPYLLQCHSVLTFREKSFRPSCLRQAPTGKQLVALRRSVDSVSVRRQVCEGDRSNQQIVSAYNDVITMISGFLTSAVISSLRPRQHIEERLTLIIDFYHLLLRLFSSEAFDKRTNRVSTDVADKHARYIRRVFSPAKSRRSRNEIQRDKYAHRCVDYCFANALLLYLPVKVRHETQGLPRCLVPCRENGGQYCVFLASSCLTP